MYTETLLAGWRVLELGQSLPVAVAGRVLADLGADVERLGPAVAGPDASPGPISGLERYLGLGKTDLAPEQRHGALTRCHLIIRDAAPVDGPHIGDLDCDDQGPAVITLGPYGQTGPRANQPASEITLFAASGIARLLTGQVDNLAEPPGWAPGQQSAFIAGITGACAGVLATLGNGAAPGARPHLARAPRIDVSTQEALATIAIAELAQAGLHGRERSRQRVGDGNGSTVCILPASDGYAAISPREERQWSRWLEVMGAPAWGRDLRFRDKSGRAAHWDEVHAHMCQWSRTRTKQAIADAAQAAHVPSFPLCEPGEHLESEQLRYRGFFRSSDGGEDRVRLPGPPFGTCNPDPAPVADRAREPAGARPAGPLPLSGVRVLDFSWVIAGPTTTRYLAAMGAEVIKVEAPGPGDPGRGSDLHTVLGQGKKAIVLDLKSADGVAAARAPAARCDILIENFATGVMERFGLGYDDMRPDCPHLVYVSASGMGRTGPQAGAVAYGTLLQCYSGFAGANMAPGVAPRVGMAWLDPMCGLLLATGAGAALARQRETGRGARIDFSMVEAMLYTMAEPLLRAQGQNPGSNNSGSRDPESGRSGVEGFFPARGEDAWVAISATGAARHASLATLVGSDLTRESFERQCEMIAGWTGNQTAGAVEAACIAAGIPAAAMAGALDLLADPHLRARGFWEDTPAGRLPGLPWRSNLPRAPAPAPRLGEHTESVLGELTRLDP